MNVLASGRRSRLGFFPGKPRPRLCDRAVEALRTHALRHSFATHPNGGRLRAQNCPVALRAQGRADYDGLYPRIESRRSKCPKPA